MANRYFLNIGANWGDTANWSDTSGGTGGFSVPTNADDVFFDANSGNCTVNASFRVAKSLNFTGYTNTITMSNIINCSGNLTLGASMGIAGTQPIQLIATSTITSNGKTWTNGLNFNTAQITLGDDFTISGTLGQSVTNTINGSFKLILNGGFSFTAALLKGTGTPQLYLKSGTYTTTDRIYIDTFFDGNITIGNTISFDSCTITYLSGTTTLTANNTFRIFNAATLNVSAINWNNVTFTNADITLSADLNINGLLTNSGSVEKVLNGNFAINCNGGIQLNCPFSNGTGTRVINLLGGTWNTTSSSGALKVNTVINGNITISGTVYYNTGTLTYTSGTVITTGSTLNIAASTTLNTSGMSWNNVTTSGATITLTSDLNINGLLNVAGNTLTNGSFNINVNSLFIISASVIGVNTGNPTLNFIGNGSWTGSGRLIMNTNIYGNTIISGTVSFDSRTLTNYSTNVKTINTATLNIGASSTFINCDKINFKTITITTGTTQTFNRFFSGSALIPTRIRSNTTTNYTITFQDGFEKITKFTKISNCTVSRPGQLLCITDKSNKGGNVGVRYINQMPNGLPKNSPSTTNPIGYATSTYLLLDPNTVLI